MKCRLILLLGLASLFAAGCATHQKAPSATFDRIGQEMQGALDAKAKGGAAIAGQGAHGGGLVGHERRPDRRRRAAAEAQSIVTRW